MVDFNALIVWKTFIHICFSIKSSLWALTDAYTKFRRMIWSVVATGHVPRCVLLPHRNAGRLHLQKLKAYNSVISGWVKPLQVVKRNSGYDSHDATSPSSFHHPPSDFCPSPFLTRVWGYHHGENCWIKDVCSYVLEHFGGFMRLIIFPWNKTLNFPAPFP